MKKAKLILLRHGETDYNKNHLMTGQRDIPLNETGEEQAREAGKMLREFKIDVVFASHLQRAFNTAALALESSGEHDHLKKEEGGWHIHIRCEVAEIDVGDFTGRSHKTDPEIINHVRDYYTPVPGGESNHQAAERVRKFFETEVMPRLQAGENVLIVCHAGILRVFEVVLGIQETLTVDFKIKKRIPNASPVIHEYEDGKLVKFYWMEDILENQKGARPPRP